MTRALIVAVLFSGVAHADRTGILVGKAAEERLASLADSAAQLEAAWRAFHPGETAPLACDGEDPVRFVDAELDAAPGRERALASLRWGVALVGADGKALAWHALGGCGGEARAGSQVTSVEAVRVRDRLDLVVRTHQVGHCGSVDDWGFFVRRGATLEPLLSVDEARDLKCGNLPQGRSRARIELSPGRVRVFGDQLIWDYLWRNDGFVRDSAS